MNKIRGNKYWTEEEFSALEKVSEFSELFPIGLKVIKRMPQPVSQISGPISTGGKGSIEANLDFFTKVIAALEKDGQNVFHQLPFQDVMIKLTEKWQGSGYCMPLLTEFYKPVFESGLIKKVYFIDDWQSSFGAAWEHKECERLEIEIIHLPEDFLA